MFVSESLPSTINVLIPTGKHITVEQRSYVTVDEENPRVHALFVRTDNVVVFYLLNTEDIAGIAPYVSWVVRDVVRKCQADAGGLLVLDTWFAEKGAGAAVHGLYTRAVSEEVAVEVLKKVRLLCDPNPRDLVVYKDNDPVSNYVWDRIKRVKLYMVNGEVVCYGHRHS